MINKKKIIAILVITILIIINANCVFAKTGTVTTETLRVRKKTSTDSTILEMLNQGDKIEIEGEEGDWYQVTVNGKKGYVSKQYVKITNENVEKPKQSTSLSVTPSNTPSQTPISTTEPPSQTPAISNEPTQTPSPAEQGTPSPEPEEPTKEDVKMVLGDITNKEIDTYIIPNFSTVKISKIEKNTKVQIIKTLGNWSKVSTNNTQGWIPNDAIMVEAK